MIRKHSALLIFALTSVMGMQLARAGELSTTATNPTALPADGIIEGDYPASTGETAYYFAADLKAGTLASQVLVKGTNAPKRLWLALLDSAGNKIAAYGVDSGYNDDGDDARNWSITHSGRYLIRLTTKGPELATYKVEFGGTAFAGHKPQSGGDSGYSHSFLDPTHIDPGAVISGRFPESTTTSTYYFDGNLKAGVLMTQLSMVAPKELGGTKSMMFEVLGTDGERLDSAQLERTFRANSDGTHNFAINHSGHYVMRLSIRGTEGAKYTVVLGGSALASSDEKVTRGPATLAREQAK